MDPCIVQQRGELTKLVDKNKDGKADLYKPYFPGPYPALS
jgi:hypothetical protein